MLLRKILCKLKSVEWWEVKSFSKLCLRRIVYNQTVKKFITWLIYLYLFLVYKTSKKNFIGFHNIDKLIAEDRSFIFAFWHNRLMMIPFIARKIKNKYDKHNLMTLASRHGDGQIVGMVMERFGLISILGSGKGNKKSASRIDYSSLRKIIDGLKSGYALGITPDGPRGPSQQINGELLNIAKLTGAIIVPISYSCSNFKIIKKSWDKFKIPLPFSNLCFYIGDNFYAMPREASQDYILNLNEDIRLQLDRVQNLADNNINQCL